MDKYVTSFKLVGAAYDETLVLLQELNWRKWSEVAKAAHEENLLKKRSSKMYLKIAYMRKKFEKIKTESLLHEQ